MRWRHWRYVRLTLSPGDARLRGPVERAVAFMVSARAADGMAWRYAPGDRLVIRAFWDGW